MSDAAELILRDLKALRRRYESAGQFMEARGVQRSIDIVRRHSAAFQDDAGAAIVTPQATMAPGQQIARLIGRSERSTKIEDANPGSTVTSGSWKK